MHLPRLAQSSPVAPAARTPYHGPHPQQDA
jgi:hypothetical protein